MCATMHTSENYDCADCIIDYMSLWEVWLFDGGGLDVFKLDRQTLSHDISHIMDGLKFGLS